MEILEFGNKDSKKIILIHGFQCPYQIWYEYIKHYENKFHVIVPILKGHNPNLKENFISFQDTAKEIEDYIISKYGNEIYAIYGMSMGGIIAANIWQNKRLNIDKIIFDGSPLVSYPKIMKNYLTNFYLTVTHKTQKRETKTINNAVNNIIPKDKLDSFLKVLDSLTDDDIKNYIDEWGNYILPKNIDTPKTNIYFFHGTKMNEMLAKKTAKYLKKHYKTANIKCFKNKFHCEISLFEPEEMIKELDKILINL